MKLFMSVDEALEIIAKHVTGMGYRGISPDHVAFKMVTRGDYDTQETTVEGIEIELPPASQPPGA